MEREEFKEIEQIYFTMLGELVKKCKTNAEIYALKNCEGVKLYKQFKKKYNKFKTL